MDDFTGGATADVFNASLGRMGDNDAINGAGGIDTLNARTSDTTLDAMFSNVEILNIEAVGATTLDGALITGATNVNVTGGATLTYKAEAGEEFNVSGASTGFRGSAAAAGSAAPDALAAGFSSSAPGGKERVELLDSFSAPGGSLSPVVELLV